MRDIGPTTPVIYATVNSFAPHGAPTSLTLGNGLVEQTCHNSRMQQDKHRIGAAVSLGCAADSADLLHLSVGYTDSSQTGNNGNITSQTVLMPKISTGVLALTQAYQYDPLNRLKQVQEAIVSGGTGAGQGWTTTYGYDPYGNMWWGGMVRWVPTPSAQADVIAASNRMANWGYDSSGNLTGRPDFGAMDYDAENRLKSFAGSKSSTFAYDGDGRRVKKGSVVYIYDAFGQLAQETGAVPAGAARQYLSTDHLGSTRLVTDGAKAVVARYDYEPFGGEIPANATTGNRDLGVAAK